MDARSEILTLVSSGILYIGSSGSGAAVVGAAVVGAVVVGAAVVGAAVVVSVVVTDAVVASVVTAGAVVVSAVATVVVSAAAVVVLSSVLQPASARHRHADSAMLVNRFMFCRHIKRMCASFSRVSTCPSATFWAL